MGTRSRYRSIAGAGAALLTACTGARADTPVGGLILADTVWSAQNSPYVVTSSVVVGGSATLTVEPGVTVRFGAGLSMLVGSTAFGGATFIARGTAESPIVFTSDSPTPAAGDWGQIVLGEGIVDAVIDADTGEYVSGSIIEHCEFGFGGGATATNMLHVSICAPYLAHLSVHDALQRGMAVGVRTGRVMRLHDCTFSQNGDGIVDGAALVFGSSNAAPHVLARCHFEGNTGGRGGALLLGTEETSVIDCSFVGNSAGPFGGAVYCDDRYISFSGCTFSGNSSDREGGAIWSEDGGHAITDCAFEGNRAEGGSSEGGAVFFDGGVNSIVRCTFLANSVSSATSNAHGGAVKLVSSNGVSLIEECRFEGNSALSLAGRAMGGALWSYATEVIGNTFEGNSAVAADSPAWAQGGAAFVGGAATSLHFNMFEGNSAQGAQAEGGAVWQDAFGSDYVGNSFAANTSSRRGGAIYADSRFTLAGDPGTRTFNTFLDNEALEGSAIFNAVPFEPDGENDIDAVYVCWGTADQDEIAAAIHDFFDDGARSVVGFVPTAHCAGDCAADWNGDGVVNTLDFVGYLNDWSARDPLADLDGDGVVNTADFILYLNLWAAGC